MPSQTMLVMSQVAMAQLCQPHRPNKYYAVHNRKNRLAGTPILCQMPVV